MQHDDDQQPYRYQYHRAVEQGQMRMVYEEYDVQWRVAGMVAVVVVVLPSVSLRAIDVVHAVWNATASIPSVLHHDHS